MQGKNLGDLVLPHTKGICYYMYKFSSTNYNNLIVMEFPLLIF
jgi:hypothetical protein